MSRPSAEIPIRGSFPVLVTPFTRSGELMPDAFAEIVRWYLAEGVDGICLAGDNSEAWALTAADRRVIATTAVREVRGRVPVLMGASGITARQSIEWAEIAAASGVDGLLLQPQSYVLKGSHAEIIARFQAVAREVPLPIMAYNSPRRTGINLELDTLGAICGVSPIVALKESSRDFFHLTRVVEAFGDRIAVMVGPAPFILPGVALGASGFVSSGPELLGSVARRIMEVAGGARLSDFRHLHFKLTAIYRALMETGTWPSALKAALTLIGVPAGVPREPVDPLTPEQFEALRRTLEQLGVLSTVATAARAPDGASLSDLI